MNRGFDGTFWSSTGVGNRTISRVVWRGFCILTAMICMLGLCAGSASLAATPKTDCKGLCRAALKETASAKKLKYKSTSAMDFGALSYTLREKVADILYICDDKEVYSISVIKVKKTADVKKLVKELKKYSDSNRKSDYLSDYTKQEQNVLKNAVYGSKGNYVWYIALSEKKKENKKCQKAIKKLI